MEAANNRLSEINATFYKEYDIEYFTNKGILLCSMIAAPQAIKAHLTNGYKVGKIEVSKTAITQKWLVSYAKRETVVNSYHCIEAFFRLFFAHVEEPECPWVGVEQLQNFRKFKGRVEKLLKRKYFQADHDTAIATLLLGKREMYKLLTDEQWQMNVTKAVELIDRLGHDILTNQDYNVYKHGAALLNTQFGFTLGEALKPIINVKKQDTFMYLSSVSEETDGKIIKKFSRSYKFMRWQQRFGTTILASQLINNLLNLRKSQLGFANKGIRVYSFHTYDFHKMLASGITPETVSEYVFERHYFPDKPTEKH